MLDRRMQVCVLVLLTVGLLTLSACSNAKTEMSTAQPKSSSPSGEIAVATLQTTATVTAVDQAKRMVTLRNEGGAVTTYKCGKDVVNFDQIKVGDQVKAEVIEALAVYVRKAGVPAASDATMVGLAKKGSKPGVVMAETQEVSVKVDAVNAAKHTITVTGPLGKTRALNVNPKVDLAGIKPGDDIVIRYTEGLAVLVEKGPAKK